MKKDAPRHNSVLTIAYMNGGYIPGKPLYGHWLVVTPRAFAGLCCIRFAFVVIAALLHGYYSTNIVDYMDYTKLFFVACQKILASGGSGGGAKVN